MQEKVLQNFPINVRYVPFVGYSKHPTNVDTQVQSKKERHIITGGHSSIEGGFHEFIVGVNSMANKSFENDYNKKCGTLQCIGEKDARYTHSYLVEKNKYLVVFYYNDFYNVYDMINDKWMLKIDEKNLQKNMSEFSRSVLINDEIIIISKDRRLYFYFIGNDYITNPTLMYNYRLKTRGASFERHGMCIIDFIKQESIATKKHAIASYKLKIVLFGTCNNRDILPDCLCLDILLSYNNIQVIKLSIDETLMIDKRHSTSDNCNTIVKCKKNQKRCGEILVLSTF